MSNKVIKEGDILDGKISFNASGSAYFTNDEIVKDIYISKNNTNKSLHLDKVKILVIKGNGRILEGKVIEILERFKDEFVGTIQLSDKFAFFIPDSVKILTDFYIPIDKTLNAKNGQKVVVKLTQWGDNKKTPNGEVLRILGDSGEHETEIHSILEEYGLPYDFNEDVLLETESIEDVISDTEISKRRDIRDVLTLTIDPADAKDFDDAISIQWVNGDLEVGIHIADVSHYVRPDTEIDKEAYKRGTSVYLVDRCVPMLPERLSNEICSLRPYEDKLCFSVIFTLDQNGHVINEWFGRTVINSNHRFTYEEAQSIINLKDKPIDQHEEYLIDIIGSNEKRHELKNAILTLDKIAKRMRKVRLSKGSISFDKHEMKFKLDKNNKPVEILFKHSTDATKLIEEYMLLANRHVAKLLIDNGFPVVNRAHETPNEEKLLSLKTFISQLGYEIKTQDPVEITKTLNKLLEDVIDKPEENMISNLVVRTMQKADYRMTNIGHYGLGFKHYTHFTSPIRRYPDVITHRLLGRFLDNKTTPKIEKLSAKCQYLSERERKAQKAERDSIKYMQCVYLSDKIGKVYKGMVTSVVEYGLFIELAENKCDGLLRLTDIPNDSYYTDLSNYCVIGSKTGTKIRLGDEVLVVIKSIDLERKLINLNILT